MVPQASLLQSPPALGLVALQGLQEKLAGAEAVLDRVRAWVFVGAWAVGRAGLFGRAWVDQRTGVAGCFLGWLWG